MRLLLLSLAVLSTAAAQTNTAVPPPPPVPAPQVITSGPPPSDAIVLFDGRDLSAWQSDKGGGPAAWQIADGAMIVNKTGGISTKQGFGDCQLHVEWATPTPAEGKGEHRGNSGIFLQKRYEIQVLDSYENASNPRGQAGAVYSQTPPLVNACRPPGEWQTYDIFYRAPRFDAQGALVSPAYVTVLHNGVLVQDHTEIKGPTAAKPPQLYRAHPLEQPVSLQDHNYPVKFRNIWLRKL